MKNPFGDIYSACNSPTKEHLPMPRCIDIELTSRCNMRCVFCPTGARTIRRPAGDMIKGTFDKILSQTPGIPLRFSGWGEPTLHPFALSFFRAAKSDGRLIHINTNGTHASAAFLNALMDIGIDSLKVSFQGIDRQTYRAVRGKDIFFSLINALQILQPARAQLFLSASTTITIEMPEQVAEFRALVSPLVDHLTIGRTVLEHISPEAAQNQTVRRIHPAVCPEVFDKLSIRWNGDVSACCNDYDNEMILGNVESNAISHLWNGKQIERYREILRERQFDDLSPCYHCWDYHGLTNLGIQEI